MTAIKRPLGWTFSAWFVVNLFAGHWWLAALAIFLGVFNLTIGYRVATVLGVRIPWVGDVPH
jgi:hypothetical protein